MSARLRESGPAITAVRTGHDTATTWKRFSRVVLAKSAASGPVLPIDSPARILAVEGQKRHCRGPRCRRLGFAFEIDRTDPAPLILEQGEPGDAFHSFQPLDHLPHCAFARRWQRPVRCSAQTPDHHLRQLGAISEQERLEIADHLRQLSGCPPRQRGARRGSPRHSIARRCAPIPRTTSLLDRAFISSLADKA